MIICHNCQRHVRSGTATCVFCKESLADASATRPLAVSPTKGTRAALLFGAAAVAVACGGQTGPSSSSGASGSSTSSSSSGSSGTSSGGSSSGVALYGAPAPDAGPDASDAGTVAPPYGAPAYGGPGM